MEEIDWDAISIPAEPYFMPVDSDAETELHEDDTITLGMSDSISLSETKSFTTFTSEGKNIFLLEKKSSSSDHFVISTVFDQRVQMV